MSSIIKFDPETSANNLKQKIQNHKKMTVEIVEELYKARAYYSNSGHRSDLVSDETRLATFESYLVEIGLAKPTVYRWFERYIPEQNKLLTYEELQERKQIEERKKMSAEEKKRSMIAEYRKTGKKPEGWDRSLDYIIQRDKEEEAKREQRARETIAEMKKNQEERERKKLEDDLFSRTIDGAVKMFSEQLTKRQTWKEKIRLSDSGKEDAFMDAIMDYLETLANDNRRIEACNNIIKICRNISVQLQKVS